MGLYWSQIDITWRWGFYPCDFRAPLGLLLFFPKCLHVLPICRYDMWPGRMVPVNHTHSWVPICRVLLYSPVTKVSVPNVCCQ
jgi:hypothetical protein